MRVLVSAGEVFSSKRTNSNDVISGVRAVYLQRSLRLHLCFMFEHKLIKYLD